MMGDDAITASLGFNENIIMNGRIKPNIETTILGDEPR